MVRSTLFQSHSASRPDPIRIVAISASIALNVAILALLMRPPEITIPSQHEDRLQAFDPVVPVHPPIKPIELPVKPRQTRTTPTVIPRIVHTDPPPVITDETTPVSVAADPIQPVGLIDPVRPVVPQLVQESLRPIASPAPDYPRNALRDGITGTVELELLVGVDGRVLEVHVVRGSGNRELDAAAREQVLRNWRFEPAIRDGVATQALGRVPIVFTLDGR